MASLTPSVKKGSSEALVALILILLAILIPYSLALAIGEADADLAGLAALHSRAESVYCEDGLTPSGAILIVETGLFALVTLAAQWRAGFGVIGNVFKKYGVSLAVALLLVAIPFIIAWRTDSSVCSRGKAYFWESIFIDAFILSILAISYNLLFGFSGIISFGHAAFFGMGAYVVGLVIKHLEWPWWAAVLVALLVGVLIALITACGSGASTSPSSPWPSQRCSSCWRATASWSM